VFYFSMLIFLFLQADFIFFRFSSTRYWFSLHFLFRFTGLPIFRFALTLYSFCFFYHLWSCFFVSVLGWFHIFYGFSDHLRSFLAYFFRVYFYLFVFFVFYFSMLIFLFLQADFIFFRFSSTRYWFSLHFLFRFTGLPIL